MPDAFAAPLFDALAAIVLTGAVILHSDRLIPSQKAPEPAGTIFSALYLNHVSLNWGLRRLLLYFFLFFERFKQSEALILVVINQFVAVILATDAFLRIPFFGALRQQQPSFILPFILLLIYAVLLC